MATATSYTKSGVDAKAAPLATSAPLAPGTATAGTSGSAARADHVHPPAVTPEAMACSFKGANIDESLWIFPHGPQLSSTTGLGYKTVSSPLPIYRKQTLHRIRVRIASAADAGTLSLAIYAYDQASGLPKGAPIYTQSGLSTTGTGSRNIDLTTPQTLNPGLYLLALGCVGHTATRAGFALAQVYAARFVPQRAGGEHYPPAASLAGFNSTTGSWPTLAGAYADYEENQNAAGLFGFGYVAVPAN